MGLHESYQELISMYALEALSGEERAELKKHLASCDECRRRYAQELSVVQMMPRAVEPVEPSSSAKLKLFARVDADLAQEMAAVRAPAPVVPPVTARSATKLQRQVREEPRRNWFSRPAFVFAVIAILALLAVAIWLVPGMMQSPEERTIASILNAPNVQRVALQGTPDAPDARGEMYMVPGQSQAVLRVTGLRALPPEQGYEFWFFREGVPQPSNVFTVNPDGSNTVLVQANDTVENFQSWGVTIEPRAGVQSPTGPIVIAGGL